MKFRWIPMALFALLTACGARQTGTLPFSGYDQQRLKVEARELNSREMMHTATSSGGPAAPFIDLNGVKGAEYNLVASAIDDFTDIVGYESQYPGAFSYPEYPFLISQGTAQSLSIKGDLSGYGFASDVARPGFKKANLQEPLTIGEAGQQQGSVVLWTGISGRIESAFLCCDTSIDVNGDIAGAAYCGQSCEFAILQLAHTDKPLTVYPQSKGVFSFATAVQKQQDGSIGVVGSFGQNTNSTQGSDFYYYYSDGKGHCCARFASGFLPRAYALNKWGLIAGDSPQSTAVAILPAGQTGNVTTLPVGGASGSDAYALNDYNEIAGALYPAPTSTAVPALWMPQSIKTRGEPENYALDDTLLSGLPDGWSNVGFNGINNHDQILGVGYYKGTGPKYYHSFLLSLYRQAIDVSHYAGSSVKQQAINKLLTTGPYWNLLATGLVCEEVVPISGGALRSSVA